jgi:von Willebrand factor type A domain
MEHLRLRLPLLFGLMVACGTSADPIGTTPGAVGGADAGSLPGTGTGSTADGGSGLKPPVAGGADAGSISNPTLDGNGNCEVVKVGTGPVVPDMLIVLDRSGSMKQEPTNIDCRNGVDLFNPVTYACFGVDCADPANANSVLCGGTQVINRWDPSVSALKTVTTTLQDRVSFGLMLFPDPNAPRGAGSCAVGDVAVSEDLNTAGSIAQVLDRTSPGGGTPTGPALQRVLTRVQSKDYDIDVAPPPQYVLLVTDGQPTCPGGNGGGGGDQDRALTTQAITDLKNAGVTTYVLGYDAQLDPRFEDALNEFARAGGTDRYRPVGDEQSLVAEIENITKRAASCSYQLAKKPADPSYVLVKLDGQQLNLGEANGWTITDRNVEVQGEACQALQGGGSHTLDVTVQCEKVILR